MRRFLNKRVLLIALAVVLLAVVSSAVGLYVFINSPEFNGRIRNFVVEKAGTYTGSEVALGQIRWSLKDQRLVLEDLTLRGTEPQSERPLAHFESITAGIHVRSLLQRRVDLFELTIVNPEFHLRVDSEGRTNVPGPAQREDVPETELTLSIDNLKVIGGRGIINDRQIDLDFAVTDLVSNLRYESGTQILSAEVAYAGTLGRPGQSPIAYALSSEFDYTRGSIIARKVDVASNKSSVTFQGRVDHVLTPEMAGKLAYTTKFQTAFMQHFLPKDTFEGSGTARGELEFSPGIFSTAGEMESGEVGFNGWNAGALKSNYTYRYPEKQLKLTRLDAEVLDGRASGTILVDSLPGTPRFTLDVAYDDVDATLLARVYPWDPKYMIYSRATGQMQGAFTGRMADFQFEGAARLTSFPPQADSGIVPLPADGTVVFVLRPGEADIRSSDIRYLDTTIQAMGNIRNGQLDLTLDVASSNLSNLYFLYPDANGKGTFKGTVKGPFQKPTLDGAVSLDGHKYREWTIQHADGSAKLDMQTESADLRNVEVVMGQSTAIVNGTARLDGSVVSLRIRSDHVRAEDFQSITKEKVEGLLAGNITVTSLNPIKVAGHIKGSRLKARGRTFESVEGDLTYNDPAVELRNMTISERGARLTGGSIDYNRSTGAIRAEADVTAVNLDQIREFGIPEALKGDLRRAHIKVTGAQERPQIEGDATLENLSIRGETFPRARMVLTTTWPHLHVTLTETGNVNLSGRVDLSSADYAFDASARFQDYSLERLANFSQGTLIASGEANLKGRLTGQAQLSGSGVIRSLRTQIRGYPFTGSKPFAFSFDTNRLTLTEEVSLNGEYGTSVALKGSVGLMSTPTLDLTVNGKLDLSEIAAINQSWSITGIVTLNGFVGGTTANPNISGIANVSNASLGREGVYTTISMLNGDLRFNENRVTFDNLVGRVGGGTVRVQGTGLIQNSQVEGLNVRFETEQVRLRYPAGLRSTVTGTLLLRGTWSMPLLAGDLRLDNMTYRGDFEPFLAIFRPGGLDSGGTALDRLQLSVHVEGNRNIIIQNELTNITAARIGLDVRGTLGSPSLTGHVEVSEGTLTLQNKRYEITRGNIDFVNPLRIEPVVDIQAEADVRDYRIILLITGRGDDISVDTRSDPPLSQYEIISLIAGGKTREELDREQQESTPTGTPAGIPTSEELFQGASVSILADLLQSSLGNRLGLTGLDWIRLDPHFEGASTNPSLRVTFSQQVSKDLSVTYTQDLASNQERLITVEYFLSKELSIVASREENNETSALGFDVKLRKRF